MQYQKILKMNFNQSKKEHWSFSSKIVFKFIFTYFVLFILLLFLSPFLEGPMRWFAENILNWGANFHMDSTGSGDRSFDYVRLGLNVILALIIGVIWSISKRKRGSYTSLLYWFHVSLRIFLFGAMVLYGMVKVFKGQFGGPSLELLLQPVGEMSPMGLAWTFMGHSMAYNIFLGFAEVLGGVLLLNRKTLTLGSMIIIGVMTNVAIMNFTYDIPVKLFSIHLVLMALILFMIDGRRFIKVFLKNEIAEKNIHFVPAINPTIRKFISGTKVFVTALLAIVIVVQCFVRFDMRDQLKTKSELYGIWESRVFVKNSDTLAPLLTDDYQWRYLIVDLKKKAVIKKMNDTLDRYILEINEDQKRLVLSRESDTLPHHFLYELVDPETLQLKGLLDGDSLYIQFKHKPKSDFRLLNRKFHWVNESTYNY